jgi:hypothetical protein
MCLRDSILADAVGDAGQAYGMGQWHPDRQANFHMFIGDGLKGNAVLNVWKERAVNSRLVNL